MGYLMQISNIKINIIATALFLFCGIIFLSLIPSGIIRNWVYSSAFEKFSNSHINKIRNEHTLWQKMNLWYLTRYKNASITKKRVIFYWIYWGVVFITASIFAISALGFIHRLITGFLLFPLLCFDVVVWIIWTKKGRTVM